MIMSRSSRMYIVPRDTMTHHLKQISTWCTLLEYPDGRHTDFPELIVIHSANFVFHTKLRLRNCSYCSYTVHQLLSAETGYFMDAVSFTIHPEDFSRARMALLTLLSKNFHHVSTCVNTCPTPFLSILESYFTEDTQQDPSPPPVIRNYKFVESIYNKFV